MRTSTPYTFKEGDKVVKARWYREPSADNWQGTYCQYGGDETDVPLGTEGVVTGVWDDESKVRVHFTNGKLWSLHINEVDVVHPPYTPTHVARVVGDFRTFLRERV